MNYTLTSIGVRSVAKLYGFMMALGAALFAVPVGVGLLLFGGSGVKLGGVALLVGAPLGYGLIGFVAGAIMTTVFNFCAKRVGGIRFSVDKEV